MRTLKNRIRLSLETLEDRSVPTSLVVGTNINTGNVVADQSETTIAMNPTNPDNLFTMSQGNFRRYSMDGGLTWTPSGTMPTTVCCDAKAAFDTFGNLFVTYLNGNIIVTLTHSVDGGASFTSLGTFSTNGADYPGVATGSGGSFAPGSLWLFYYLNGSMYAQGAPIFGLGSIGSFSAQQITAQGSYGRGSVGLNGQFSVAYQTGSSNGPSTIRVSTDFDGLGPTGFTNYDATVSNVGTFSPIPAMDNRTITASPTVAYDQSSGRLYMAWTDRANTSTADTDVMTMFSVNGGANWSAEFRVNNDSTTNSQFNNSIAVDQTTHFIAITWLDARNAGPANDAAQTYGTVSTKNGRRWLPNVQIATGLSNANAASSFEFGDYDTMDYHAGRFYRAWADNASPSTLTPTNADAPGDQDLTVARVDVVFTPSPLGGDERTRVAVLGMQSHTSKYAEFAVLSQRPTALKSRIPIEVDQNNTVLPPMSMYPRAIKTDHLKMPKYDDEPHHLCIRLSNDLEPGTLSVLLA